MRQAAPEDAGRKVSVLGAAQRIVSNDPGVG